MIGTKRHIKSIWNCQSWKLENNFQSFSSMFMQFHPFPILAGLRSLPLDVALAATRLPEFVASCQAALQTWIVVLCTCWKTRFPIFSNASMEHHGTLDTLDTPWIHHPKPWDDRQTFETPWDDGCFAKVRICRMVLDTSPLAGGESCWCFTACHRASTRWGGEVTHGLALKACERCRYMMIVTSYSDILNVYIYMHMYLDSVMSSLVFIVWLQLQKPTLESARSVVSAADCRIIMVPYGANYLDLCWISYSPVTCDFVYLLPQEVSPPCTTAMALSQLIFRLNAVWHPTVFLCS